jgi:hypothetical protein
MSTSEIAFKTPSPIRLREPDLDKFDGGSFFDGCSKNRYNPTISNSLAIDPRHERNPALELITKLKLNLILGSVFC